jgi:replicative DNA helicase
MINNGTLTDEDAERGVISCCLNDYSAWAISIEKGIESECFSRVDHQAIWMAMQKVDETQLDDGEFDFVSVAQQLGTEFISDLKLSGRDFYNHFVGAVDSGAMIGGYLNAVLESARKRKLRSIALGITDSIASESSANVSARVERELGEINGGDESSFCNASQLAKVGFEELDRRIKAGGRADVELPLQNVNQILGGGLKNGEMTVLAARPSVGKTALVLNCALHASKAGKRVLIFSLEMSQEAIADRLHACLGQVESDKITQGRATEVERMKWDVANAALGKLPIYVDTAKVSLSQMRSRCRRLHRQGGVDLIIVDYCQLVRGDKTLSREQQIAEVSWSVKELAKECKAPAILVAQLNRQSEVASRAPRMSDLRESGALEQDADVVTLLYRASESDRENLTVLVAKNRNGATGKTTALFQRDTQQFIDPPPASRMS